MSPLISLSLLYFLFRLPFLSRLPVFSDEALYMEWGWRAIHFEGQLFHSLNDAKQPFLMWLFGMGQTVFPDPLFGSRFVSVLTGLLSLVGIYFIGRKYFDEKVARLAGLFYIAIPFFVFFDRQALMESALVASSVWSLYFYLEMRQRPTLKNSLLLGLVLGLGFFVKNTAALFLLTFLVLQTLSAFQKNFPAAKQATLTIFSLTAFLAVNSLLFFQPLYWSTLSTNSRWTFTLKELFSFPVNQWGTNLLGNIELSFIHLTPPVFILALVGMWLAFRSEKKEHRIILLWLGLPFIPYLLTERFMNFMIFRYLTPMLPLITIFAALAVSQKTKFLLPLVVFPAIFSAILLIDPAGFFRLQSKLTKYSYQDGYVTGFDTGYQVNEIVRYLKEKSVNEKIYVAIAVHTFNPESGIWAYFRKDPNVTVSYFDQGLFYPGDLDKVDCFTANRPLFFIAKLNDTVGLSKFLEKVTVISNKYNSDYSTVYILKRNCTGTTINLSLENPINH
jgi:4-amino-4-deoxy-L-arabinose transferase-like glycosyltransferase